MQLVERPIEGVVYADQARASGWLAEGAWKGLTAGDALRRTAAELPDAPAYLSDEGDISFRALDETTDRVAAALLAYGLAPGDRAIFQLGTTIEAALALIACFKAGIIPVCAVPQYRDIEIGQLARLSGARGYFVQADFSAFDLVGFARGMMAQIGTLTHLVVVRGDCAAGETTLAALAEAIPLQAARARLAELRIGIDDVLSFQLSGGTTGVPKIIPRHHGEYLGHSEGWMRRFGIAPRARLIWCLPLLHNAGQLYVVMPVLLHGVSVVLMPRVDVPRMMELIERHRVTHALSIGPVAALILNYKDVAKHDLSSLHLFAMMSRSDTLEAHLGVPCCNLYGITEGLLLGAGPTSPVFMRHETQGNSGNQADELSIRAPDGLTDMPPGEAGELCFRGPSSLRAYYRAPADSAAALTPDGFVRSGDLMTAHLVDGEICYRFEGRLRDNVNRGGEKIACEEVENLVGRHPAVADARLVPMPDPIYGERGCLFLIPRPGFTAPDMASLGDFLTGLGLARFKCPERIEIVAEFPVTRVGKLDKPALRRMIAEKLAREQAAMETGAR